MASLETSLRPACYTSRLSSLSPLSAGSKGRQKYTLYTGLAAALVASFALFNFWSGEASVDNGDWSGMGDALHDLQRNHWARR
jgi:hypothetical protein